MNIYYDPTDGVLLASDNKGGYTVVLTNAQLDPSRLSLSEDGYLTLLDFEGNPHTMCNEEGTPISLLGPTGAQGITPQLKIEDDYWYVSYDEGATWKKEGKATGNNGQDGADGKDGQDGEDGKNGITPQLKIVDGYWYISYDNGTTWTQLDKATGENGQDGKDGADGEDGEDGILAQLVVTDNNLNFYLNTDGYALEKEQSWTPLFEFIENESSTKVYPTIQTHDLVDNDTIKVTRSKKYTPGKYLIECSYTHTDGVVYKTTLTINIITGATHYDLKVSPSYIKYNPNTGTFENLSISVYYDCTGGGYYEENQYILSALSNLHLTIDTGFGDDSIEEGLVFLDNGTADFSPNVLNTTTIKLVDQDNDLKDFQTLSVVLDGKGMATEFPESPNLGDSLIWGGKSELNNNCFLGYVVHGQTYVYSLLPAVLGTATISTVLAYAPIRLMIYIPELTESGYVYSRTGIPSSLTFNDDVLIEEPTRIQIDNLIYQTKMSWDVCIGMTLDEIKSMLADVINLARCCFDMEALTTSVAYSGKYALNSYKTCSAIKTDNDRLSAVNTTAADAKLFQTIKNIVKNNSECKIGDYLINYIDTCCANMLHCDVYLIPYQPVLGGSTLYMWGIPLDNSSDTGWVPTSSSLSNGINTNQVGTVSINVTMG